MSCTYVWKKKTKIRLCTRKEVTYPLCRSNGNPFNVTDMNGAKHIMLGWFKHLTPECISMSVEGIKRVRALCIAVERHQSLIPIYHPELHTLFECRLLQSLHEDGTDKCRRRIAQFDLSQSPSAPLTGSQKANSNFIVNWK